jgi:hypothetical protein
VNMTTFKSSNEWAEEAVAFLVKEYEVEEDPARAAVREYMIARGLSDASSIADIDIADLAEHAYTYPWPA